MIEYNYVYDLANHPYRSEFIDETTGWLRQPVRIPAGVTEISGARARLSRYGEPGPVELTVTREGEEAPLGRVLIAPEAATPVFERMVGGNFAPASVREGETVWLNLRVLGGRQPLDAYRVYGPNDRKELAQEGNSRTPYWWYESPEIRLDDVHAPLPIPYAGAGYAPYAGGQRLDAAGAPTWSIAFQLLTPQDAPSEDEQLFEFAQRLTAEPFAEWTSLRDPRRQPEAGEVWVDGGWRVVNDFGDGAASRNAALELKTFLGRVMDAPTADTGAGPALRLERRAEEEGAPEAFTVEASPNEIVLAAGHERGLLRAVYWLEDQMLAQRAPALAAGRYAARPRFELRMVPGIYPAPSYFMLREAQIWTRGYLWRMARAGYNAVYFQASIEDFVVDSAIFPEMNDPEAPAVIERLRRVVDLAAEYGIDFYWDIKTGYEKKFPESVYERLPHLRTFTKFGNFPCTGQAETLDFIRETVSGVFAAVRNLRGLVLVYDTEGFYSCLTHNYKDHCPYCKDYPVEELAGRIFTTLKESARVSRPDNELILWTYICDEPWNYQLIRSLPDDVALMACYSQLKELDRAGERILTDDYSLCSDAPSDYYLKVQALAVEKGLRFYCKTEDTFAQEFVSTPFTPCLEQHQSRWDRLSAEHACGYLSQYLHLGVMPTPCQATARLNAFEVWQDGARWNWSAEEKLLWAARVNYGPDAAPYVVKAWRAFSAAIRDEFPYTWGVCRYPGPLQSAPGQPFYLDPQRIPQRHWSRGYVNDLAWTGIRARFLLSEAWNASHVARCLEAVRRRYAEGNAWLARALEVCAPAERAALTQDWNVSRMQQAQVTTILNLLAFIPLRDAYARHPDLPLADALIYVLENERANVEEALRLARRDSRLGFSCEGDGNTRGGHFTPATIETKITGLVEALEQLRQDRRRMTARG